MSYDRTASMYDNRLSRAQGKAKAHWGSGWANLTEEMQNAYVSYFLVAELAAIDFEDVIGQLSAEGLAERLRALSSVLNASVGDR